MRPQRESYSTGVSRWLGAEGLDTDNGLQGASIVSLPAALSSFESGRAGRFGSPGGAGVAKVVSILEQTLEKLLSLAWHPVMVLAHWELAPGLSQFRVAIGKRCRRGVFEAARPLPPVHIGDTWLLFCSHVVNLRCVSIKVYLATLKGGRRWQEF